jgi:DNA-binding MarR family transcriptional regulator
MTEPPIPALTDHVGYWLRLVSNAVSGRFAERLAARGFAVAEWVLLRELHDGDLQPSALADRIGMTRGGITKLADRMIARGLVQRRPGLEDGRTATLGLTDAGRAVTPELARLADENERAFFGALPEADRTLLLRLMADLARLNGLGGSPVD